MNWLKSVVIAAGALGAAVFIAGQFGLFSGKPPTDLGLREGKLKAPSNSPNSVSSQAALWPGHPQQQSAQIAPLAFVAGDADGNATMVRIVQWLSAYPGAKLVVSRPDYIQATATTRLMKYTDDLEFWLDRSAGVVQVRSASRVGKADFGVNRARIETLRGALVSPAR
jgi:uncharacterized protein (DUF1499 family)